MKALRYFWMLITVFLCAVSCGAPDGPAEIDPESMSAAKTAYTIGAEGGSLEFQVSTNVDLTVTPADTWVKYTTTKAVETKTIVVTVEPNTSTERRSTKVTVKGKEKQLEIAITQEGAAPVEPDVLEAGTTTYSVPAEGGEVSVAVTTNVDMTVTTDSGWIKYTSTKAASQKTVCFTVEANPEYAARSGKATISGGDKSVEIVFNQAAKPEEPDPDKLTVAQTEYTVGAAGGNVEVKVNTNCEEVSATVDQTWVKFFGTKARAFADRTLTFSVLANTTYEERTVTATITAGTESATVTIKQAAAEKPEEPGEPTEDPVLTAGQATYNLPAEGGSFVVDVTTNIEYTVTCDAMWLRKTATKATRTDHITYMATPNSGEARSAQISFNYGEITVIVTVNQAAYEAPAEEPELELSATEFQVAAEGDELNVRVTHNYDYTVNGAPEWVVVDIDGDDCFITVTENTDTEARVATLEFASEGVKKTVTIAQDASEVSSDPFDCGSDLSKNETANCYVVTKAGDYSFKADVMGNGYFPEGWIKTYDQGVNLNLWPDDGNTTIPKASLKRAVAAVLWDDGDCLDGDPVYNSTDKRIEFKTSGNSGAAHIALKDQYGEILWSWLVWCTERPEDITFMTEDDISVTMLDRNIGAVSAKPEDDALTYGYYYQWGRKDPLKLFNQINKSYYMQPNSATTVYYAVTNPEVVMKNTGKTMEWYNGKLATVVADLWGDPYNAGKLLVLPCDQETAMDDIYKTLYDPCPPGYMVVPSFVFKGLKDSDVEFVGTGAKFSFGGAEMFVPFAGYGDEGNIGGYDVGYYGYTDFYKLHVNRGEDRTAIFWLGSTGRYRDGNFLAGTMLYFATNAPEHDEFRDVSIMNHIRARAQPVRCMREPKKL